MPSAVLIHSVSAASDGLQIKSKYSAASVLWTTVELEELCWSVSIVFTTSLVVDFLYIKCCINPLADIMLYCFKVDPYLQSLVHWGLRRRGLVLLNSLLVHCFQPDVKQASSVVACHPLQSSAHKAIVCDVNRLLDGTEEGGKVSNSHLLVWLWICVMALRYNHAVSLIQCIY